MIINKKMFNNMVILYENKMVIYARDITTRK